MEDGATYNVENSAPHRKGCFVSPVLGFVLLVLAFLVPVAVGITVYFVGCGPVECNYVTESDKIITVLNASCAEDGFEINNSTNNAFSSLPSTTSLPESSDDVINYRLPTSLIPVHYDIELFPDIYGNDPNNFTFSGTVVIEINVSVSTRNITLNAHEISITENSIQLIDGGKRIDLPIINYTESHDVTQFYVIHLIKEILAGQKIILTMKFEAEIRHDSVGLYLTYYLDGETKVYMVVSQFAGPHARKAFPCFDEPAMKATFSMTVVRKSNTTRKYRCLSNQDVLRTDWRPNGYVADVFWKTPPMSTYLLAVIVCDYLYLENTTREGVKYRTWANPNKIQFAHRPHEFGVRLFEWYNSHFLPKYPLPKIDNIPIPKFKFSGMENWGLVTYKTSILFEPGVTTAVTENWMLNVISHEISHSWFGNLVTPKWFRWVWLNEGFASFWDATVIEKLYPEYRKEDLEIVESLFPVMVTDSFETSSAMSYDVISPTDVDASYNPITYKKAASVIRMMRDLLGEDVFIAGLNRYLQKYAYSAVDQDDMFSALNEEILSRGRHFNITRVFDSWVNQKNYPVLHVRVEREGVMHVQQERFISLKTNDSADSAKYRWQIPISFTSSREKDFTKSQKFEDVHWLATSEREKIIKSSIIPDPTKSGSWVVVNLLHSGFYRVNYDDANWLALIQQLNENISVIAAVNRAQIINDAWNLASAGLLNVSVALRTLNFLASEFDYLSWQAAWTHLIKLNRVFDRTDVYGALRTFLTDIVRVQYSKLNMDSTTDSTPIERLYRRKITIIGCSGQNKKCLDNSKRIFTQWMYHNKSIDPNLQDMILCHGVKSSGYREWAHVLSTYRASHNKITQSYLVAALTCTREAWLIKRLLDMCLDSLGIRSEHVPMTISLVAKNHVGRDMVMPFVINNLSQLLKSIEMRKMLNLLMSISSYMTSPEQLIQIRPLLARKEELIVLAAQKLNATVTKNIQLLRQYYPYVKSWLQQSGYSEYM